MVFRVAGMIKKEIDKDKAKKDFKSEADEIIINLRQEIEHLKQFDFKDAAFQPLVVDKWLKDPVELVNPDGESLSKLHWYNAKIFQFTVIPLITKSIHNNMGFRILTLTDNLPGPVKLNIHSEAGKEVFIPKLLNRMETSHIYVAPNKVLMYDLTFGSSQYASENFVTIILTLGNKALTARIKVLTEGKIKASKEYEDLKTQRFYDLVDIPYVTPTGARYVILNNRTHNSYWKFKQKKAEKLKLYNLDETDQEWDADYRSLSEYWG